MQRKIDEALGVVMDDLDHELQRAKSTGRGQEINGKILEEIHKDLESIKNCAEAKHYMDQSKTNSYSQQPRPGMNS